MATTPTFQNQLLVLTFFCALVTNYIKPGVSSLLKLWKTMENDVNIY